MSEKVSKVLLGIDIGGTAVKIGIVDQAYDIIARCSIPTEAARPYEQVIADIGQAAAALLAENGYGLQDCLGAGVGSPGTVDSEHGAVLYSNNIRWDHVPLAEELKKHLPVPIFMSNDANCAALGEVLKGAAKGYQNAVFLTLGTGVGGGIVMDGKIFEGGHPGGAELGHIKNGSEGRKCTCGRYDCLEAYASATALIEDAKNIAKQHPESVLWELCGHSLAQMDAKMPFDAAKAGDPWSKALIQSYINYLADGITDIANIFRPDVIVLGGGVSAQGEYLTEPLNRYLEQNCFGASVAYVPRVVIAQNGNDAGIIGAAGLVETGKRYPESAGLEGTGKKDPESAVLEGTGKSDPQAAVGSEILFLEPVCTENIWGGNRLKEDFHYPGAGEHTGECWGISAHPNGDGTVKNGRFAGQKLSWVWKEHPELFGRQTADGRFPLLVKIIDAKEDLSIQVHPNDAYADSHENGASGKTECWYVMDCREPASLVIGHNAQTKQELNAMIADGRWKELLREIPVKKGDFIQIDPGTVHAIKGGSMIFETQQNSDITYRLYDYGRLSNGRPRELHLKKSMDVITVPAKAAEECVISAGQLPKNQWNLLYACSYYQIFKLDIERSFLLEQKYPFLLMSVLDGDGYADGYPVKKGDHFILPSAYGSLKLEGQLSLMASTAGSNV